MIIITHLNSGNAANKTVSGGGGSAFAGPVTVVK